MNLIIEVLAIATLIVVKGGGILAFIAATKGLISFDCAAIIFYLCVVVIYVEAMYGEREKRRKNEKNR